MPNNAFAHGQAKSCGFTKAVACFPLWGVKTCRGSIRLPVKRAVRRDEETT